MSENSSIRMARIRQSGTKAELLIRKELFRLGYRYRVNVTIKIERRVTPDIVVKKLKLAVYIDGCFWHGCPEHGTRPKENAEFWSKKIRDNQERDQMSTKLLVSKGWSVLRFWEHEDAATVAAEIGRKIDELRKEVSG